MSKFHTMGAAFLVTGTSIGAGMLALPVVTSLGGFLPACVIFLLCWGVMTATGFLFLEIALRMGKETNIISMASFYLGRTGKIFSWIVYLFLFYCLSIAYVSGGGALIKVATGDVLPSSLAVFLFVLIFGFIVYRGANSVDRLNLLLIVGLITAYFCFIFVGFQHIEIGLLCRVRWPYSFLALPVILISFGYQGIVPSLTYYMKRNSKKLKIAIMVGTTVAFVVYVIWGMLIQGIVPVEGAHGLAVAKMQGQSAITPLRYYTHVKKVYVIGQFFSFFALTTSFLGVSLGLFDFLADGLKISKVGLRKVGLAVITFLPSLIIAMIYPYVFIIALEYAGGIGGVLLLVFLPTLMVWYGRYVKKDEALVPQLPGGKVVLVFLFIFVAMTLIIEIIQQYLRFFINIF